ncbi:manganese efflux pump MntP family protein [uncultured Clostridium sp.]|uniref:manganese efflux pump MntP n=1 Tax=uncultured Clostridium sp. TaxID=59620 RepID=UPI002610FDCC|nr:manganese efflux pump MntP family protein [uncultured Clostridium sp.]
MSFISIILIGIALAMDAFAVTLSRSICYRKFKISRTVYLGLTFGVFQGVMILIGRFIGGYFSTLIDKYNSIIVFIIFVGLGVKLLIDAIKNEKEEEVMNEIKFKTLMVLGFATSIDALAVGVTFVGNKGNIIWAPLIIGVVTFILTAIASVLGCSIGNKVEKRIGEFIGAVILIGLGLKVLF